MRILPASVQKVINEFAKLPGVGSKTAARMTYYYLRSINAGAVDVINLAKALLEMKKSVQLCEKCFNISENNLCPICSNELRDKSKLCVVEEILDVVAFEDAGVYNGYYFVLGGVISPADGVTAEHLRFLELSNRVEEMLGDNELELIIATNPSLEGEATAAHIKDILKNLIVSGRVNITRLAMGLPTGADLEYADRLTLKRALEGRKVLD